MITDPKCRNAKPTRSRSNSESVIAKMMAPPRPKTRERKHRVREDQHYERAKRALDLAISTVVIVLLLPALISIALLVRASGPGPILYKQRRLGRGGREFWCLKFRTMVSNADEVLRRNPELLREFQQNFKIKNDPRITPIGRFLRSTSLDELPQFFNVLLGDMSLIGPRPIVKHELEKYGPHSEKLLSVLPGLGGVWQASGRSDVDYAERVEMDMFYIEHRSISLDLKLLALTARAVLKRDGAC